MARSKFFAPEQASAIKQAIVDAEKQTAGEIRVYVESLCTEDVLDRAAWLFREMGIQHTKGRTGVLIYIAVQSRKLAIIGDAGINKEVSPEFWEGTRDLMIRHLRNNDFTGGIVAGVRQVGDLLHDKFPRQKDDENELPDEVACGQ